ncbi:MAG: hypothetical protein ACJAYR_001324 [Sneathiella sp.]|jgi:hypothetical protein
MTLTTEEVSDASQGYDSPHPIRLTLPIIRFYNCPSGAPSASFQID